MKFTARVYEQNKGSNNQSAYIATIRKNVCENLGIRKGSPLLIKIN